MILDFYEIFYSKKPYSGDITYCLELFLIDITCFLYILENKLGIVPEFANLLIESCSLMPDKCFFFEYFSEVAFASKITQGLALLKNTKAKQYFGIYLLLKFSSTCYGTYEINLRIINHGLVCIYIAFSFLFLPQKYIIPIVIASPLLFASSPNQDKQIITVQIIENT